jgi:hypothetical protein
MDEFLACSDLCEENGHLEAAEVLRSVSKSGCKAFVVVERGWEYDDCIDEPNSVGSPSKVYFDRELAEAAARAENARTYREYGFRRFCYNLEDITTFPVDELNRRISEILGRPFESPEDDRRSAPFTDNELGNGSISDDQMIAIADLFKIKFFYVVETEFAS